MLYIARVAMGVANASMMCTHSC